MWWEAHERRFRWRQFVMVCQDERWGLTAHGSILRVGDGVTADKIGPAIPGSLAHLKEQIGNVADRTASPVICTLINSEQSAIGQETEAKGVTYTPCYQF